MEIEFIILGKPHGKGRPRFARRGKFVTTYTPKTTAEYETQVRLAFCDEAKAKGVTVFEGNIRLDVYAWHKIPTGTSKRRKAEMAGRCAPVKPDIDNVVKCVADALNGVAWADDNQIVVMTGTKKYTEAEPHVTVKITEVDDDGKARI